MSFGEAIAKFYTGYFKFEGRASRAEYWWPFLMRTTIYVAIIIAAVIVAVKADTANSSDDAAYLTSIIGLVVAYFVFALFHFIPTLAVSARRFHDLDQTGWLVLVFAIANAFVGLSVFAQLIWYALRGTDGPNQYGPDPLGFNPELFG